MQIPVAGLLKCHLFLRHDDSYLNHQTPQRHLGLLAGEALAATRISDVTEPALDVAVPDPPASVPGAAVDDHGPRPVSALVAFLAHRYSFPQITAGSAPPTLARA